MAIPVEMPKMSDTMTEGVLVSWLADEGQQVSAGDVIAQVETDKATMDLEVYDDGVLLKRVIDEGDAVPIGGLIAVLGKEGENISSLLERYADGGGSGNGATGEEPETAEPDTDEEETDGAQTGEPEAGEARTGERDEAAPPESTVSTNGDARVKASPLARRLADEHGFDLAAIEGTGPEGRVVKRDIEAIMAGEEKAPKTAAEPKEAAATSRAPAAVSIPEGEYESVRISQMRKAIARRLSESKFSAPHFYLTVDIAMEKAVAARSELNALSEAQDGPKISYNDLVTKACAVALRQHPWVNASWLEKEGEIRKHRDIHIAIAVAIDEGLITPVIRNADQKGLTEIAAETRSLAERARAKELQPEEYQGSTFSTSNLGMFGIEEFTAIINPPNACILAIGAIRDEPVVVDGAVVAGKRMKVTLSCDHRVVDGATGSRFLATVKALIEEPLTMLL